MLTHDMPFLEDALDRDAFLARMATIHSTGSRCYRFIERMHDATATFFSQEVYLPGMKGSAPAVKYIDYVRMVTLVAVERAGVRNPTSIAAILGSYNRGFAERSGRHGWDREFIREHCGDTVETNIAVLTMSWMPEGYLTMAQWNDYDRRFNDMKPCDLVYGHLSDGLVELLTIESARTGTERLRIYRRGYDHFLPLAGRADVLWREIQHACTEARSVLQPIG